MGEWNAGFWRESGFVEVLGLRKMRWKSAREREEHGRCLGEWKEERGREWRA